MRILTCLLSTALLLGTAGFNPVEAKIEAIQGKQYTLTSKHGPWMVMVAVFSAPPEERRTEGLSPEKAAEELVYELRTKGIPAYSFKRNQRTETIEIQNRLQQATKASYKLPTEICVLAGNYRSPEADNQLAKRTLAWLKEYRPECLEEQGGIFKATPGQPGILSGAFLTINPMLDPAEVKRRQKDPELIRYNSHFENSLLQNPGKYSVTVASFYPNSVTQIGSGGSTKDKLKDDGSFAETANQAAQVMRTLRARNFEAYVFHDHKRSIVTIGSFNSDQDPGIAEIRKTFGAQWKTNPQTGQPQLIGEVLILPSQEGQWMCTFDPDPALIEVPYKK